MKVHHADHGVTADTLAWALGVIKPTGFFIRTLTLPEEHPDLLNALYGPASGDAPVSESEVHYTQRSEDRPMSRMVARPKRPTRLLTIIGMGGDNSPVVFTAYGGPAAEREPGDRGLDTPEEKAAAEAFWASHALASE